MLREVELLPHQHDFVADETSEILALVGGYGSGKTTAALSWACARGAANWPAPILIVEPTYPMVRDILVTAATERFEQWGIPWSWHKTDHVMTIGPQTARPITVFCRSGDKPERLAGLTVGAALLDEHEHQDEAVAKQVRARIRHPLARVQQLAFTGTPEGFGWGWEWLENKPDAGTRTILAPTRLNTFVKPSYESGLRARFSEAEGAQYLDGIRTKPTGRVYARFDRGRHIEPCTDLRGERQMWCDFNVRLMAWGFVVIRDEVAHVWGELVREDTDTMAQAEEAARVLAEVYGRADGVRYTPREAAAMTTVVCDAAGSSPTANAKMSNVAILISAGFKVKHPAANPFIDDRVYSVNLALHEDKLRVAPGAKYVAKCLEQQGWGKDGKPEKAQDPKKGLDHGCFVAGTLVESATGPRPIEAIRPGDLVYTRAGLRPVVASFMSSPNAPVMRVRFSGGRELVGTGDHPVFVEGRGFVRLDSIGYGDTVVTWDEDASPMSRKSRSTASSSDAIRRRRVASCACTSWRAALGAFIKRFGERHTERSRLAMRCIIATAIRSTTPSRTSNACPRQSMRADTSTERRRPSSERGLLALAWLHVLGTLRPKGAPGTPSTRVDAPPPSTPIAAARCAGSPTSRAAFERRRPSSVRRPARRSTGETRASTTSTSAALNVASPSDRTDTTAPSAARSSAVVVEAPVSVGSAPVFNLTVDDAHEYFAGGVLVHNCDLVGYGVYWRWPATKPKPNTIENRVLRRRADGSWR
jgi:hypothetical protein